MGLTQLLFVRVTGTRNTAFQVNAFQSDAFQEDSVLTTSILQGGIRRKVIRLSELMDGDRRTTAEFIKSQLRIPFIPITQSLTTAKAMNMRPNTLTSKNNEDIIAIILASES